jgi:hypothetical protein
MHTIKHENVEYMVALEAQKLLVEQGITSSATFWRGVKSGKVPSIKFLSSRLVYADWVREKLNGKS